MSDSPTEPTERPSATALAMVALLTILWGVNFPSIKVVVSEFPPWTFRVICVACGGAGLLGIGHLILRHRPLPARGEWGPLALAGLLNITGFQICVAFGLQLVEANRGVVIAHTMPLWATLFAAYFLRERLTVSRCVGLCLGMAGLAVLIGPELLGLQRTPTGILLLLCAAISWGAGTVVIKSQNWTTPVIILTGWQIILGGVPMLLGMLVFEAGVEYPSLSRNAWIALVYSALVPMIVCHLTWYTLVRMLPAAISAISTLAIPIVGVYSSALLLGEQVGSREWLALVLVIVALGIVLVPPSTWRLGRR